LTTSLEEIRLIAEGEFASIVDYVEPMGAKLRLMLSDSSYMDVWLLRKLEGRFGFHWELKDFASLWLLLRTSFQQDCR